MDETTSNCATSLNGQPTCLIVLGMAGSGKTTFVQKLTEHLASLQSPAYIVNLDPAVHEVPYQPNIDIRESVNYKEVMKTYSLGPNGGIMTSLNLFSVHFKEVMACLEKRKDQFKYMVFDTPGQIEVFSWSASGSIITDALASAFPTVVVYVMDTSRNTSPKTFMSNMLYACGIVYKTKLPFIIVLNKTDIIDCRFALEWMKDFEAFDAALDQEPETFNMALTRRMSLVLDIFYNELRAIGVSSVNGEGFPEFLKAVDDAKKEYENEYLPAYEKLKSEREKAEREDKRAHLDAASKGKCTKSSNNDQRVYLTLGRGETDEAGNSDDRISDEEDEDEKKEYESFGNFLARCKAKQQQQQEAHHKLNQDS